MGLQEDPIAAEIMRNGGIVTPTISHACLRDQIMQNKNLTAYKTFVLDGFPREPVDIQWIEQTEFAPDIYIILDMPNQEMCMDRVSNRSVRPDDDDAIERLICNYYKNLGGLEQAIPKDKIMHVSANFTIDQIHTLIVQQLSKILAKTFSNIVIGIQAGRGYNNSHGFATSVVPLFAVNNTVIQVKPRDAARFLQNKTIDVFIGYDDCLNYLVERDFAIQPVCKFAMEYPHAVVPGHIDINTKTKISRISLVSHKCTDIKCVKTIASDYHHANRYFPNKTIINTSGSAEEFVSHKLADAALVIVETGEALAKHGLVELQHIRYIRPNIWVHSHNPIGRAFFQYHAAVPHYITERIDFKPDLPVFITPETQSLNLAEFPIDIDSMTDDEFNRLPLVIEGHSKEVRYAGRGHVLIRFKPTVYSFTHNRADVVDGSSEVRLASSLVFLNVLRAAGIRHSYIKITDKFVLSKLVMPHRSEFTKYNQPIFVPSDLTFDEIECLQRGPPIEVIIKTFHGGTSKHRYKNMHDTKVRKGHFMAGYPIRDEDAYPIYFIQFDWHNPIHGADGVRTPDEILQEDHADYFIDVSAARRTAQQVYAALRRFLDQADIVCNDLSLFITEDGSTVYGEISPDCGRFQHFSMGSLDKDVFRAGGSHVEVIDKWKLLHSLIMDMPVPMVPVCIPTLTRPIQIMVGTTNPYKIREIASMLSHLPVILHPHSLDVPEPYDTFAENAEAKAIRYKHAARKYDFMIVEDSGLCIDALGGQPGARSARYSVIDECNECRSREQIDLDNNALVLETLGDTDGRQASFRVVFIVEDIINNVSQSFEGRVDGTISTEARGTNGFGYDTVFVPAGSVQTLAEMDTHRKSLRSHLRKAMDQVAHYFSHNSHVLLRFM